MPQSNSSAASSNSASREGKRRRLGERDVSVQSGLAGMATTAGRASSTYNSTILIRMRICDVRSVKDFAIICEISEVFICD